jgi:hypothetical protein
MKLSVNKVKINILTNLSILVTQIFILYKDIQRSVMLEKIITSPLNMTLMDIPLEGTPPISGYLNFISLTGGSRPLPIPLFIVGTQ